MLSNEENNDGVLIFIFSQVFITLKNGWHAHTRTDIVKWLLYFMYMLQFGAVSQKRKLRDSTTL